MYTHILFDLDGTLTDPAEGITNSVIYALKKFNITVTDRTSLFCFIGPPLQTSFMKYYGFSEQQALTAIRYYREYFADKGIFENKVYPQIPQLLQNLKNQGKQLFVASSKAEEFVIRILKHFDLFDYFDCIAGASMDLSRCKKEEVIAYAFEKGGISNLQNVVMVGDREQDITGANKNGIDSIGVLYGYGSRDELQNAGTTHIAPTVMDIEKIIKAVV